MHKDSEPAVMNSVQPRAETRLRSNLLSQEVEMLYTLAVILLIAHRRSHESTGSARSGHAASEPEPCRSGIAWGRVV